MFCVLCFVSLQFLAWKIEFYLFFMCIYLFYFVFYYYYCFLCLLYFLIYSKKPSLYLGVCHRLSDCWKRQADTYYFTKADVAHVVRCPSVFPCYVAMIPHLVIVLCKLLFCIDRNKSLGQLLVALFRLYPSLVFVISSTHG